MRYFLDINLVESLSHSGGFLRMVKIIEEEKPIVQGSFNYYYVPNFSFGPVGTGGSVQVIKLSTVPNFTYTSTSTSTYTYNNFWTTASSTGSILTSYNG